MFDYWLWSPASRTSLTISVKRLLLTQPTLPVLLLLLSLVSCAHTPVAETPAQLTRQAVKCEHPLIDPRTKAGLYEAIRLYWGAVEDCNARNGFSEADGGATAAVVPVGIVPAAPGVVVKTTTEKVTTAPTGASVSTPMPTPLQVIREVTK